MAEFLLLMHAGPATRDADWGAYLGDLRSKGVLQGGSAMGGGVCVTKSGDAPSVTAHLSGYIKVEAESLEAAQGLVNGNPVYEAGGVVEVRALPQS
jgi:hypothetical protein